MIATAAMMIEPPMKTVDVTRSFKISQPSKTATRGFTYAYVVTIEMRTLRSSHTYALNATREPKTTRYPIARRDFAETAPGWNDPKSPPIALTRSDATPPHSISIPVATAGRSGKDALRA